MKMNPLLSSRNLFILKRINPRKPKENDLVVINEFDGFYNYLKNQVAIDVFGERNEKNRAERTKFARTVLIDMIGEKEFMRLREMLKNSRNSSQKDWTYNKLSKTERLVFKLMAQGFTQIEIAKLLHLTKSKVASSKKCIYKKMNFINKGDLMLFATKNKLV